MKCAVLAALALVLAADALPTQDDEIGPLCATFSIVCRDPKNGDFAVGVTTMPQGVRRLCPFARAGVGAVATQAQVNVSFGRKGLDLMEQGKTPEQAVKAVLESDRGSESRQVGMIDAKNPPFAFTGKECNDFAGHIVGKDCSVQGNLLVGKETIEACARTFEETPGSLAGRILKALRAGKKVGGDKRGHRSCAVMVASKRTTERLLINVFEDDNAEPVERVYEKWLETCKDYMELGDRELKAGDAGGDVAQLRKALAAKGEAADDALIAALKEFQKAGGLTETGALDTATIKLLIKRLEQEEY